LALVELGTVTVEQIKSATVSEDGKEVWIEGVSFGGFPNGKRDLRVILALYGLDEPQHGRVDLVTRTSDGVNIL
jgi:hypothetical protein